MKSRQKLKLELYLIVVVRIHGNGDVLDDVEHEPREDELFPAANTAQNVFPGFKTGRSFLVSSKYVSEIRHVKSNSLEKNDYFLIVLFRAI